MNLYSIVIFVSIYVVVVPCTVLFLPTGYYLEHIGKKRIIRIRMYTLYMIYNIIIFISI